MQVCYLSAEWHLHFRIPLVRWDFVLGSARALWRVIGLGLAGALHLLQCSWRGRHLGLCWVTLWWWFPQHMLDFCIRHCHFASFSLSLQLLLCPPKLRWNMLNSLSLFFLLAFTFLVLTAETSPKAFSSICIPLHGTVGSKRSLTMEAS